MHRPAQKILDYLKENKVKYEAIDHEPVFTSEQAAAIRGISIEQGAKSLLLKADDRFVLVILSGDKRLDSKKLKELLSAKNLRFASPEEVQEIMGCAIGACYPFGNLIGIEMLVDNSLARNQIISFNPGVHDRSLKINWEDYVRLVNPHLVDVSI